MRITSTPRDVDLSTVDLFDPTLYSDGDPHPIWTVMRETAPLHRQTLKDGRSFASVTRYADACKVLGDSKAFTSERGSLLEQLGHGDAAAGQMLVSTDAPRHTALRRPLQKAMTPRALAASADRVRAAARRVIETTDGDLAKTAFEFPMTFTGALMGLPEADWTDLVQWTSMAAAPDDPAFRIGSRGATLAIAHHELFSYFATQAKERPLGDDSLLDILSTMDADGAPLIEAEIVYNCYSLLLGANATTPHAFTGTVLALLDHPEQLEAARRDPSLVDSLVEEGLRWTSPANSFLRHAVDDIELSGGVVNAGEPVAVWVGSANRDPEVFEYPFRFDIRRTPNRHITFGFGPHYCLGAHLARMALRALFTEFLETVEHIELDGPVGHTRSNFVAGISTMPVRIKS
ncbi:cytochrome P450 [Amycolatopsis sp. cg5]|uniref:cytochrome P450 n=1 Tax=Amycolatopsis sp. cg5 TaxID=3238802 RepID=UPI003523738C